MHPGKGLLWSAFTRLAEDLTLGTSDGSGRNHDQAGKIALCRFYGCGVGDLALIDPAIALVWEGVVAGRMELFWLSRI